MSEKGGNHIWPAYVDMMTVLLMVYLLLALLFQVVVATTKTAVSQSSQAQQRKEAAANQVTEQKETSQESPKEESKVSTPNSAAKSSGSAGGEKFGLVELDPAELKLRDGDFSIIMTEKTRNFLTPAEINLMKKWIGENLEQINAKGVRVFSVAQNNRQTGNILKIQFDRALGAISVLFSMGVPQDKIIFDNVIVRDVEKDYVALRIQ